MTPDGEAGLNYLCAGYKKYFRHIAPAMNGMVKHDNKRRPFQQLTFAANLQRQQLVSFGNQQLSKFFVLTQYG